MAGPLSRKERKLDNEQDEDIDQDVAMGRRIDMEEAETTNLGSKWKELGREYTAKEKKG